MRAGIRTRPARPVRPRAVPAATRRDYGRLAPLRTHSADPDPRQRSSQPTLLPPRTARFTWVETGFPSGRRTPARSFSCCLPGPCCLPGCLPVRLLGGCRPARSLPGRLHARLQRLGQVDDVCGGRRLYRAPPGRIPVRTTTPLTRPRAPSGLPQPPVSMVTSRQMTAFMDVLLPQGNCPIALSNPNLDAARSELVQCVCPGLAGPVVAGDALGGPVLGGVEGPEARAELGGVQRRAQQRGHHGRDICS